jgi:hypothetical protein
VRVYTQFFTITIDRFLSGKQNKNNSFKGNNEKKGILKFFHKKKIPI